MSKYLASIVIPICNQYSSLQKVLYAFSYQSVSINNFEIIIIDDGSTDELSDMSAEMLIDNFGMNIKIVHQENRGRAVARNIGILNSESDIVIFCDGDRFPKQNFIEQHLISHNLGSTIVIGASFDFFGNNTSITNSYIDWKKVIKYSRLPKYFKEITSIYNDTGATQSRIAWLSFLVGNSSIEKNILQELNGFSEDFTEWGFEHFDIGLRMQRLGYSFQLNLKAANYHIPHSRTSGFYDNMIQKNMELFSKLHPDVNCEIISKLLTLRININEAELKIFK